MEQPSIAVTVKLNYWESYVAAVVVTVRVFRKILYIFGFMGGLWILLLVLTMVHPSPEKDWYQMMQTSKGLAWVFVFPVVFVFVLPLLSAAKVVSDDRIRKGVNYVFSENGIHVESTVAKVDLQWEAIREALETRAAFLLFVSANLAHTLPKRCYADAADILAVRNLLRVHIRKAKLRKD